MSAENFARRLMLLVACSALATVGCQSSVEDPPSNGREITSTAEQRLSLEGAWESPVPTQLNRLRPILHCVERLGGGHVVAHFGYSNPSQSTFELPVDRLNSFRPIPRDRGQPTSFAPGWHNDVVQVEFVSWWQSVAWTLGVHTVLVLPQSRKCATSAPIVCGDGKAECSIGSDGGSQCEECDDANAQGGDGCSATCTIEPGWACDTPGSACGLLCGNGKVDTHADANGTLVTEQCDDGNAQSGDGCSASCTIEAGGVCQTPGQACCKNQCIEKDTNCVDGQVQDCVMQATGCTNWTAFSECPDSATCVGADCRSGIAEPSLTLDGDTTKTLDGTHVFDGDLIIQNRSRLSVPTGKLIVRAKRVLVDPSSSIVVAPTGRDPRGQGDPGGYSGFELCGYGCSCYADLPPAGAGYGCPGQPACGGGGLSSAMVCRLCGVVGNCGVVTNHGGAAYGIADDEIASGAMGADGSTGGGYIAIFADMIQIDGGISAQGTSGGLSTGSGGLIYLRATNELTGTPMVLLTGLSQMSGSACGTNSETWCPSTLPSDKYPGSGGPGVIKLLHGPSNGLSLYRGNYSGVVFDSVMPPEGLHSSTHPRQYRWYNDGFNTVNVGWTKPFAQTTGYCTSVNTTYGFVPGPSNADYQAGESVQLLASNLASGTNYFHLATVGASSQFGTIESRFVINVNSATPSISSPTHPAQSTWYGDGAPSLSWTLPAPVQIADTTNFYWVLDPYFETVPTVNDKKIPVDQSGPTNSLGIQLPSTPDGIWFFHLVAQDTMGYLTKAAALYRLQIGADPGTGTVSGTVTDAVSGVPLADVEVSLNRGMQTTQTDSLGLFTFDANVYAQGYEIRARLAGHADTVQPITVGANQTTAVNLALASSDTGAGGAGATSGSPAGGASGLGG